MQTDSRHNLPPPQNPSRCKPNLHPSRRPVHLPPSPPRNPSRIHPRPDNTRGKEIEAVSSRNWTNAFGKMDECVKEVGRMRQVPWKSGASAPRKAPLQI